MSSAQRSIQTGLGPLTGALPTTGTAPLTGQGILNLATLGTTPVKVLGMTTSAANRIRRMKVVVITLGVNVAMATVAGGAAAPTITALGAGAATEGSFIVTEEWMSFIDTVDVYLVAGAANTVVNITVVEQ
jgi:hypothetical protein